MCCIEFSWCLIKFYSPKIIKLGFLSILIMYAVQGACSLFSPPFFPPSSFRLNFVFGNCFRLRSLDKLGFLSMLILYAVQVCVEFGAFLRDFEFKL